MILAFDTSAAHCAAALLSGDTVLAETCEEMAKGQAERLMPLLAEVLEKGGASWRDLDRIGVGIGPGNFTGIRIAVSAARGLALSLGIPALGISTLAAQAEGLDDAVLSVLDARRGTLFAQLFHDGQGGTPLHCARGTLPAVPPGCAVVGFDAEPLARDLGGRVAHPVRPLQIAIARIAAKTDVRTQARPAPLYLRAPDAAPPRDPAPVILP